MNLRSPSLVWVQHRWKLPQRVQRPSLLRTQVLNSRMDMVFKPSFLHDKVPGHSGFHMRAGIFCKRMSWRRHKLHAPLARAVYVHGVLLNMSCHQDVPWMATNKLFHVFPALPHSWVTMGCFCFVMSISEVHRVFCCRFGRFVCR